MTAAGKARPHPAKQERSRHTLHRLLSAAEALLEHGGLDAATVPAIADAAGVSVGVVYRRFPDKDALIRAVYLRFFETARELNRMRLETLAAARLPLPEIARRLIAAMTEGTRRKRGLLRALRRYAQTHPDPAFRRAAKTMNRAGLDAMTALLLSHRDEIRHPDPQIAVEFGLLAVASVLQHVILDEERLDSIRVPDDLDRELVRLLFGYLGIA